MQNMSATEIIEQIKTLPREEQMRVIEYVHQLDGPEPNAPEMTERELLSAARRAGTFSILDAPGEDIYSSQPK